MIKQEPTEKRNNIRFIALKNYVQPKVTESASKEWVTYGKGNEYFQYLIDRSRGSATNGAVIQSCIDYIYGKGLNAANKSSKPDEWAKFLSIFGDEEVKKVISDVKRMGQGAFQIQYSKAKTVLKAVHHPVETLAPEKKNEKGEIEAYYYSAEWSRVRNIDHLERIPAFGTTKNSKNEILYIRPYSSGQHYFSTVDYQGGLQYAELEEEIGNYHINNIQNGLAPSMMINYNNGWPGEEKANAIEKKIYNKFSGSSNTGKVILSFNDNKETEATISPVMLSDASEQYTFLSEESVKKILVSHRVTSPLLMGISVSTGFGSNADELKTASLLFEALVSMPVRQLVLKYIDDVLSVNKISLDLFFESLNPFGVEKQKAIEDVKLSSGKDEICRNEESDVDGGVADLLISLGEDISEDWELYDEVPVDYDIEDKIGLVDTGKPKPNSGSEQDGEGRNDVKFYVRYKYAGNINPQREFCRKMMAANKVYRKEDIMKMGTNAKVNPGHGVAGANTYSIWKYKGGVNCHHQWFRQIYTNKQDGEKITEADKIGRQKAGVKGFKPEVNEKEVATPPSSMKDGGHHPSFNN